MKKQNKNHIGCNYNCETCKREYCIYSLCKGQGFEHFQLIVHETKRRIFYVNTRGFAFSVNKASGDRLNLKPSIHGRQARVAIHGLKNPELKRLVWMVAKSKYPMPDEHIVCKDGNESNCNIENLTVISKSESGKVTGPMSRSQAVIIETKDARAEYRSVREAAKALWCSYQTLLDYLSGALKDKRHSSLWKRGRKIYYKEKHQKHTGLCS